MNTSVQSGGHVTHIEPLRLLASTSIPLPCYSLTVVAVSASSAAYIPYRCNPSLDPRILNLEPALHCKPQARHTETLKPDLAKNLDVQAQPPNLSTTGPSLLLRPVQIKAQGSASRRDQQAAMPVAAFLIGFEFMCRRRTTPCDFTF